MATEPQNQSELGNMQTIGKATSNVYGDDAVTLLMATDTDTHFWKSLCI